ncbi:TPA: hypothetical protein QDC22_007516 [Burkholderia stabilis]|nr:hypothetical protein [Burkholderia stabilis]HDR9589127.1 hypothetical protein [Burkholderia stabilis]HDR9649523.1 hypothetical protein [Burkholderia stabilis]HDR9653589.1 hypothetical protein [Burkholderia stabilis]HDR9656284.1 hypothetical protein [Burkholderia stabilis]
MPDMSTSNPTTTKPALPDGLEIFRAGRRTAQDGQTYNITPADLAASAAAYDPAVHEAPLVIGHPEHDKPAYGWVKALHVAADVLQSDHQQVDPTFAEYVAAGRVKKRSAAFYHPEDPANPIPGVWYVRHVGFLGAQPPAVKGLRDPSFTEGDAGNTEFGLVYFSEPDDHQEQTDMSKELQEQLDAANAARKKAEDDAAAERKRTADAQAQAKTAGEQLAAFAEAKKSERHAAHVSFAEARVKDGKLLPKDSAMLVVTLDRLADSAPVEFSEGDTTRTVSPSQWLQDLISGSAPKVEFGERAPGQLDLDAGSVKGKSDAEIDKAAQAHAKKHNVSYAEALRAVTF